MAVLSLPSIFPLVSWRNVALVLALLNLKNLPLGWHVRVLYHFWRNLSLQPKSLSTTSSSPPSLSNGASSIATTHPIFSPVSIFSRSPLFETDYNLHKSNSTYFSDLDISRTALVTKLYSPGFKQCNAELEAQGHKGRSSVILGSVHASFRKEIAPYEKYEVRSRVLGWDRKWLVIGSWFVRPANKSRRRSRSSGKKGEGEKKQGEIEEEVVLACALNKYVFKKGRFTIPPEQGLRAAGWLPERPEDDSSESTTPNLRLETPPASTDAQNDEEGGVESSTVFVNHPPWDGEEQGTEANEGLTGAELPEALSKILSRDIDPVQNMSADSKKGSCSTGPGSMGEWDWARIEKERLRGLELVRAWMALDGQLLDEFTAPIVQRQQR